MLPTSPMVATRFATSIMSMNFIEYMMLNYSSEPSFFCMLQLYDRAALCNASSQ